MNVEPLSHKQLFDEAMKSLETLDNPTWTDFNIHDPGITILENLAHALHDLSFKISLPIEDHVASAFDDNGLRRYLPIPEASLQSRPITDNDLRSLLLDLHYVRNAWIDNNEGGLRDVLIDPVQGLSTSQKVWLRQAVREVFVRWRIVGTDLNAIHFIKRKPIRARITLAISARLEEESICKQIALIFEKTIQRPPDSEDEEISSGEMISGPPIYHGRLSEKALENSQPSSRLEINAIRSKIEALAEGLLVQNISLHRHDNIRSDISGLPIDKKDFYELDIDKLEIILVKNGITKIPDLSAARQGVITFREQQGKDKHMKPPLYPEEGKADRNLYDYSSILNEFPAIYGLVKGSIPPSAKNDVKGKAKQLQGFIILLEQLIANTFERMRGSPALLQICPAGEAFQAGKISNPNLHDGLDDSDIALNVKAQALLANSHEIKKTLKEWGDFSTSLFSEPLHLSANNGLSERGLLRFEGWNYLCPPGDISRLTWIEKTIADNFMTSRPSDVSSVAIIRDTNENSKEQFQYFLMDKKGKEVMQSSMVFNSYEKASHAVDTLLRHAASKHRYFIETNRASKGEAYYTLYLRARNSDDNISIGQTSYTQLSQAERDRDALVENALALLNRNGVYLVEHILLRPSQEQQLPPAYLHQVSLVMPSAPENWISPNFNEEILDVVEELLPAALLPNIVWLNPDEIVKFEEIYGSWLDDFWGGGPSHDISRKSLINFLKGVGISGWYHETKDTENIGDSYGI